jgi:glyoxylase I family protein
MPMPPMPAENDATPFASMRSDHVAVRIPDVAAGKRWFVEKLDFRVVHEWRYEERQFAYLAPATDDGFLLELMEDGSPMPTREAADLQDSLRDAGYHHFCLHVDSVDEALEELRRRGVSIVRGSFEIHDISRRLALFADPWGNFIELSEVL